MRIVLLSTVIDEGALARFTAADPRDNDVRLAEQVRVALQPTVSQCPPWQSGRV